MSGIAEVLANLGYEVSGSDKAQSPITLRLESLGVKIFNGHCASHLRDSQVVVVSSAIPKDNPEIAEASRSRIPIVHRSEMLAELMRLKAGVLVAGTHGKTTTTSILSSVMTHLGFDPTIVIGGRLNSLHSSARLGKGDFFLAEADESDGSFLRLTPTIAVVTNIDNDHLDHYASLKEIIHAFETFIDKIPFYGGLCACIDDPLVRGILPNFHRRLVTYGLRPDADVTATNIVFAGHTTSFTPIVYGKELKRATLRMPGSYNIQNALASFAVASVIGTAHPIELDSVSDALAKFEGVLHRFTVVARSEKVEIVDDYAHNPAKISSLLRGIRESFPKRKVCVLFQPHRFSRLQFMFEEFATAFAECDSVIVTPVYAAGEANNPQLTPETIAKAIGAASNLKAVFAAQNLNEATRLAYDIVTQAAPSENVIIVTVGAGDIRNAGKALADLLQI